MVLTADQASPACRNCDQGVFTIWGSYTMFCILSPKCVVRSGEIQSVVLVRGSSLVGFISRLHTGLSSPEPGDHPCSKSPHSTGQSCGKYNSASSKTWVSRCQDFCLTSQSGSPLLGNLALFDKGACPRTSHWPSTYLPGSSNAR